MPAFQLHNNQSVFICSLKHQIAIKFNRETLISQIEPNWTPNYSCNIRYTAPSQLNLEIICLQLVTINFH